MKGELHPAVKHLWGGLRHIVRTFLDMDDSIVWFDLFLVGLYRGGGGIPRWIRTLDTTQLLWLIHVKTSL